MTLDQLAALLDQLKRPIEEAPRDGEVIAKKTGGDWWWLVSDVRRNPFDGGEGYIGTADDGDYVDHLTHFLPLPKRGPVEFEVVPKDAVEDAYSRGYDAGVNDGGLS